MKRHLHAMYGASASAAPQRPPWEEHRAHSRSESIRFGEGTDGVQRAEVHLSSTAFAPHRHDSYAIGVTLSGVQRFRYRGDRHVCLPGQLHVLHPDELHDGVAGTEQGFGYRILYVAPELVRDALGGASLPFVASPVRDRHPATRLVASLLRSLDDPITDLGRAGLAVALADALTSLASSPARPGGGAIDTVAVRAAREHLAAHACERTSASDLERLTGIDRYTLARHFRAAYGTSPDRYRTLRRLECARREMSAGRPLAEVAAVTGFADQSHLTRQFKNAFGLTPSRWITLAKATSP